MAYVLLRHKITDFFRWKAVFDQDIRLRQAAGESSARIFRSAEEPGELTLLLEWDSREHAQQFLNSEQLRRELERAGVVGLPEIRFLDEVHLFRRTASD